MVVHSFHAGNIAAIHHAGIGLGADVGVKGGRHVLGGNRGAVAPLGSGLQLYSQVVVPVKLPRPVCQQGIRPACQQVIHIKGFIMQLRRVPGIVAAEQGVVGVGGEGIGVYHSAPLPGAHIKGFLPGRFIRGGRLFLRRGFRLFRHRLFRFGGRGAFGWLGGGFAALRGRGGGLGCAAAGRQGERQRQGKYHGKRFVPGFHGFPSFLQLKKLIRLVQNISFVNSVSLCLSYQIFLQSQAIFSNIFTIPLFFRIVSIGKTPVKPRFSLDICPDPAGDWVFLHVLNF